MQLNELYPTLKSPDREALAKKAEIGTAYLYQLATRFNGKKPSLSVMQKLCKADKRLKLADLMAEFADATEAKAGA